MNSDEKKRYRATKAWKEIRLRKLQEKDWTCEICSIRKKKGLHIHHLNEAAYGQEELSDLAVLCSSCHKHIIERFLRRREIDIEQTADNLIQIYTSSKSSSS